MDPTSTASATELLSGIVFWLRLMLGKFEGVVFWFVSLWALEVFSNGMCSVGWIQYCTVRGDEYCLNENMLFHKFLSSIPKHPLKHRVSCMKNEVSV